MIDSLILATLKATFLLAVLLITIDMHFDHHHHHHFIADLKSSLLLLQSILMLACVELSNLLFNKSFKLAMNLTSVRENCRDKSQTALLRNATIFSYFLIVTNL